MLYDAADHSIILVGILVFSNFTMPGCPNLALINSIPASGISDGLFAQLDARTGNCIGAENYGDKINGSSLPEEIVFHSVAQDSNRDLFVLGYQLGSINVGSTRIPGGTGNLNEDPSQGSILLFNMGRTASTTGVPAATTGIRATTRAASGSTTGSGGGVSGTGTVTTGGATTPNFFVVISGGATHCCTWTAIALLLASFCW